ncbi:MAG: AAA family ATPase [Prevotellaceae bacterium]|nr:AAA family ATPase [Prevotellaceae bacterium]
MKRLPYGISDFRKIITENFYFVDKSEIIPDLENIANFIFLLRPRRFGKSIFSNMLAEYYDINNKECFNELFGDLYIGQHPTKEASRYMVLKFDFSTIKKTLDELEKSFDEQCKIVIKGFLEKYKDYFSESDREEILNYRFVSVMMQRISLLSHRQNIPIYLFIDEYDNFSNTILSIHGKEKFKAITHGTGFYRDFFQVCKPSFDRIYLTGVSPITYDDLTSGFNIGKNISQLSPFHKIIGFTEEEVRAMIEYYRAEGCIKRPTDAIIEEMKPWYDNYCFSKRCYGKESPMYNSNMVLFYMSNILLCDQAPDEMLDRNVATDFPKLRMLLDVEDPADRQRRIDIIRQLANTNETTGNIVISFPAEELKKADNFVSLLFYYGLLTFAGEDRYGRTILRVPNNTMRQMYLNYLLNIAEDEGFRINDERIALDDSIVRMAIDGEWKDAVLLLGELYSKYSSIRNSIDREADVQGFLRALLCINQYYAVRPEVELNKGFCDLLLSPNGREDNRAKFSYLIELKYAKADASDEQIAKMEADAKAQLLQYTGDKQIASVLYGTELRGLYFVFRAHELVRYGEEEVKL